MSHMFPQTGRNTGVSATEDDRVQASAFRRGADPTSGFLDPIASVDMGGCNSTTWSQVPGHGTYFVGRRLNGATPERPCGDERSWNLWLGQMDWTTNRISYVAPLMNLPASIEGGKYVITTAYDPDIVFHAGEFWIAFECHGRGFTATVAVCMAPTVPGGLIVDLERAYVAIRGDSVDPNDPMFSSASVPKLLSVDGHLFLYWSAVRMHKSNPNIEAALDITTRGIELAHEQGGARRWVPNGYGPNMPATHPLSAEVFGLEPGSHFNSRVSDSYQIFKHGPYYYLVGSEGGGNCIVPFYPSPGCYRLTIRRSTSPLGHRIFNGSRIPAALLPPYVVQYVRFVRDPSNQLRMMGQFVTGPEAPQFGFALLSIAPSLFMDANLANAYQDPLASVVEEAFQLLLYRSVESEGTARSLSQAFYDYGDPIHLLMAIYHSNEAKVRFGYEGMDHRTYVDFLYRWVLQRGADAGGLDGWASLLEQGALSREGLFTHLVYSAEFAARHPRLVPQSGGPEAIRPPSPNRSAVYEGYQMILGRAPDPGGLEAWARAMDAGMSKMDFMKGLWGSPEFQAKVQSWAGNDRGFVNWCYQVFLGRDAEEVGLAAWTAEIQNGHIRRENLMESFAGSEEFKIKHPLLK